MGSSNARRKRTWLIGCMGVGLGLPLLCATLLVIIFSLNNRAPQIAIPSPVMPVPNAYDDFVKTGQLIGMMKHKSPLSMPGPYPQNETFANYAACAKDAQPGLALLRQALSKSYLHPPERSFTATNIRIYAPLREVARTVVGAAGYYARIGQYSKAADLLLDGVEMGVMMPRGGVLIADLVGIAVEAICTHSMEPLLLELSGEELTHVAARLERIATKRVTYSTLIMEEGWMVTAAYQELLRDPKLTKLSFDYFEKLRGFLGTDTSRPITWSERWQLMRFGFANKEAMLRTNFDYYKQLAAEQDANPYTGQSTVTVPKNLLMELYSGILITARCSHEVARAVQNLLRVEVALLRYRKDHGGFPEALSSLSPTYLKAVPDDPFGGATKAPFRYRRTGSSFILYSLGTDLQDSNGTPTRFPGARTPGDIVAGHLGRNRKPGQ